MAEPVTVPQAVFGGEQFWQRLSRLADADHEGHPRWLSGHAEPDNVYRLWCQRCDVSIVEMIVERESPVIS